MAVDDSDDVKFLVSDGEVNATILIDDRAKIGRYPTAICAGKARTCGLFDFSVYSVYETLGSYLIVLRYVTENGDQVCCRLVG
jgi:hypothetical protein